MVIVTCRIRRTRVQSGTPLFTTAHSVAGPRWKLWPTSRAKKKVEYTYLCAIVTNIVSDSTAVVWEVDIHSYFRDVQGRILETHPRLYGLW